jgi:hypothetical protein
VDPITVSVRDRPATGIDLSYTCFVALQTGWASPCKTLLPLAGGPRPHVLLHALSIVNMAAEKLRFADVPVFVCFGFFKTAG